MGEMADMLLEQAIEGDWINWDMFDDEPVRAPKILKCSHCKKPNLVWRHIKDAWVMFEPNSNQLHTCAGYTPNIEVLKELARRQMESSRAKELNGLYNRMMKAGGFKKIANVVTNTQLLDLFVRVNREHGVEYEDVGWGRPTDYSKQISQMRAELLKRMNKQNV